MRTARSLSSGFTLVELLVSSALFALLAVGVYQSYATVISLVSASRVKIAATDIANEQLELIRNLPYADVGVVGSIPSGVIPYTQTITKDGFSYTVTATIRNVDDSFDGTIGGSPNDLSPADYKLVHIDIDCETCKNFETMSVATRVAPKNLETASTNGALFIRVFDGNGVPVPQAEVTVRNDKATTSILINDVTDNQGMLQIVDAPPGVNAYNITVTKSGFTTDQTYATSTENPNPSKPHVTVLVQQVTQVSFVIDQLSSVSVTTVTPTCAVVPSVPFTFRGNKLIGSTPDVYKYSGSFTTNGSGVRLIDDIEWDTYALSITGGSLYLAGVNPLLPVSILPGATQNIQLTVTSDAPRHLLVTVKDSATQLPLSGATVTIDGALDQTKITGRGFITQTDWSAGPGQETIGDLSRYYTSDGNIDVLAPTGELTLSQSFGSHVPSGSLLSSVFDSGTTSNFGQISWAPISQPIQVGSEPVRFQLASAEENTASTTWEYAGPDGTLATYYTTADANISSIHNGDRFIRYRVLLNTASTTFTPRVSDVSVSFTSACIPPGQVIFSELPSDTYTLRVQKTGYGTYEVQVPVASNWQSHEVILIPE